jgi:hypothetical protein
MYLVVIAWMYVVLMMSVAEATNSTGTILGAVVTFFLYGVGPAALVAYLMGTPARRTALKKREAAEREPTADPAPAPAAPGEPPAPSSPPAQKVQEPPEGEPRRAVD